MGLFFSGYTGLYREASVCNYWWADIHTLGFVFLWWLPANERVFVFLTLCRFHVSIGDGTAMVWHAKLLVQDKCVCVYMSSFSIVWYEGVIQWCIVVIVYQ